LQSHTVEHDDLGGLGDYGCKSVTVNGVRKIGETKELELLRNISKDSSNNWCHRKNHQSRQIPIKNTEI
jgi:hypothetical protein